MSDTRIVYEEATCPCGCGRKFRKQYETDKYYSEKCKRKVQSKRRRERKKANGQR
jgi:hypothetical protein